MAGLGVRRSGFEEDDGLWWTSLPFAGALWAGCAWLSGHGPEERPVATIYVPKEPGASSYVERRIEREPFTDPVRRRIGFGAG